MEQDILALGFPGSWEWIIILLVALVIFGRRLPDVARSIGKSIVEFKKGIRDVSDDIDESVRLDPPKHNRLEHPTTRTDTETPSAKNER